MYLSYVGRHHQWDYVVIRSSCLPASSSTATPLVHSCTSNPIPMTQAEAKAVRRQVSAPLEYTAADVTKLIEREYKGLQRLIQRQTRDEQVAADLLNEAACVAWDKWRRGKIARPAEIGGYIYQVAVYLLRNRRRVVVER